ncbi:thymidine kinase [Oceanivirga miroungae]|uniref:Thymidine kinase n=1 Tax=Oceanivirga miroungae TaxID=1130046 RepID=A0A6I8MBR5_9FUSO|nr:thymidine kinase [Oceanivirga miroungae]VWL85642.1 thymidine kinase [Oceanivirga miroungae]
MENFIGRLEVVTGSMFSGKSEELIRRLRRANYAKQKILVFSPSIDNRYGENGIYSHNKNTVPAYSVSSLEQMEKILQENIDVEVIGIDEIQFLPEGIVELCKKYVDLGKRVIVAGLDQDFRAEPFKPLPELMALADDVTKLKAICMVCGKNAYSSQRLINGEPAFEDDPLVSIGSVENYEARCRMHHIVRKRQYANLKLKFVISLNSSELDENIKKDYYVYKLDTSLKVSEIRDKINDLRQVHKKIIIFSNESVSKKIEGNYTIIDLMKEYSKLCNIVVYAKKEFNIENSMMTTLFLLNKCNLSAKEYLI